MLSLFYYLNLVFINLIFNLVLTYIYSQILTYQIA